MAGADRIGEVNAAGVVAVARAFRVEVAEGRQSSGGHMPCPACGAGKRHTKSRDKRGAVGLRKDAPGWRCFQCDASGDAFTLAALLVLERRPTREDFGKVLAACADLGLCSRLDTSAPTSKPYTPAAPRVVMAPAPRVFQRPPGVADFWAACRPVDLTAAHPSPDDLAAAWFLARRAFYAPAVARLDLARLAPGDDFDAWPAWWPSWWAPVWRLVLPAFEADGTMASMHARAVVLDAAHKTTWAAGCDAAELLFCGYQGAAMLRGDALELDTVEIVEGMTDTIAASLRAERHGLRRAVLGVVTGGPPALARVKWPAGVTVLAATDADDVGDKFAAQIRAHIPAAVRVLRKRLASAGKVAA